MKGIALCLCIASLVTCVPSSYSRASKRVLTALLTQSHRCTVHGLDTSYRGWQAWAATAATLNIAAGAEGQPKVNKLIEFKIQSKTYRLITEEFSRFYGIVI